MYKNHTGTSKFLVKSELDIDTNHYVVHRKVHCFLWLGVVLPNLFHVYLPCCAAALWCSWCTLVSASAHLTKCVLKARRVKSNCFLLQSMCLLGGLSSERMLRTGNCSCQLQEMNVSVLLPTLVLIRASPSSCWTRDQWSWISWETWNMFSFLWAWNHRQPFQALWMGCGRKQGRRKKTPGWFSLLESDSHSCRPGGEWFKPPVNDLSQMQSKYFLSRQGIVKATVEGREVAGICGQVGCQGG